MTARGKLFGNSILRIANGGGHLWNCPFQRFWMAMLSAYIFDCIRYKMEFNWLNNSITFNECYYQMNFHLRFCVKICYQYRLKFPESTSYARRKAKCWFLCNHSVVGLDDKKK